MAVAAYAPLALAVPAPCAPDRPRISPRARQDT
jgi:hypothetical protein